LSEAVDTAEEAAHFIAAMQRAARGGVDPIAATMRLEAYGLAVMDLALRGLEEEDAGSYLAGWRRRSYPPSDTCPCG
jgi:hypothetical protein